MNVELIIAAIHGSTYKESLKGSMLYIRLCANLKLDISRIRYVFSWKFQEIHSFV